jgi:hypothetical protein
MQETYIVSGYMRSGTSMMMDALTAGGLTPAFDARRDKMNDQHGDDSYKPNPNGFYELNRKEYHEYGFPRKYEGKLIKCLWGGVTRIVVGNYKVIFMLRDPEEIRQSFEAFFSGPAPESIKNYDQIMQDTIDMLSNRLDTHLTVISYRSVIDDPQATFRHIAATWPIDSDKAAAVVTPELCRFRKEHLTEGI